MANPNQPPEPPQSISVAELRRRLLSSTPPPMVAAALTEPPVEDQASAESGTNWGAQTELLSRLRMPGTPTPPRLPALDDAPARPSISRRTPVPGRNNFDSASGFSIPLPQGGDPNAEAQRLKAENKELRTLLDEMKHLLQEASETEARYVEREKELAATMEEKERQIEELSSQLQIIEEQIARGELAPPAPTPKTRGELEEWSDELEKESFKISQERRNLDMDRQQLREDEEALESQMREMEVSMARERAMIARQETELKRLSAEIQHELELMQRGDATLRDQMAKFHRRAQEVMTNRPGSNPGRR